MGSATQAEKLASRTMPASKLLGPRSGITLLGRFVCVRVHHFVNARLLAQMREVGHKTGGSRATETAALLLVCSASDRRPLM